MNVIHHNWVPCTWKVSKFEEECCPTERSGRCNRFWISWICIRTRLSFLLSTWLILYKACKNVNSLERGVGTIFFFLLLFLSLLIAIYINCRLEYFWVCLYWSRVESPTTPMWLHQDQDSNVHNFECTLASLYFAREQSLPRYGEGDCS